MYDRPRQRGVKVLLFMSIILPQSSSAQGPTRWLALSVVTEYRAAPIYVDGIDGVYAGQPGLLYNIDDQLSGLLPGVDIRKNIYRNRIEVGYGLRFKYGHLMYANPGIAGLNESINAWTTDHLLFINGRFPVGEKKEVRLALGHAFMNRGSDFATTVVSSLPNGQTVSVTSTGDFQFITDFASLSYNVNGLEGGIIVHYADETHYFNPSSLVLLSVFLKYDIWK